MRRLILIIVTVLAFSLSACGGVRTWCGVQAYPREKPAGALDPRAMMHPRKQPHVFSISTGKPAIRIRTNAEPGGVELSVHPEPHSGQGVRYLLRSSDTGAAMACVTAQGGISAISLADTPPADWLLLVVLEPQHCYMIWNPANGGANRCFVPTGSAGLPIYATFALTCNAEGYFAFREQ